MANFSAISSSLQPPDGDGAKNEEQRGINKEISVDLAKRFFEFESQNHRLLEENQKLCDCNLELEEKYRDQRRLLEDKHELIIRLKEEALSLEETVKRLEGKCERLKEKHGTLREESESGDRKWKERLEKSEEKCWRLEVDNSKLQIDLQDARRGAGGIGEMAERIKAVERLLEEKGVEISELLKKNANLEREKMKIEEELGDRVIKLEESVAKWVHHTSSDTGKAKTSGDTRIDMVDLGCNVQDKGNGVLKGSGPKSIGMSLLDPKKENLEDDVHLIEPVTEKATYAPKSTDFHIVISDDEEEEKQTPSFASPSSAKCPETKRKLEASTCSAEKQAESKRCKSNGSNDGKLWETAEKMYDAFTTNNELCIKSICALYRKHKSLGIWKNRLGNTGFKPELAHRIDSIHPILEYIFRGVALGKLLTSGDPEGRMKKTVADLEREDPGKGLKHCKFIAQQHNKELFEIYNKNLDPFFLP